MTGKNKSLGATLLIAGTAIGAGMLALPAITAAYGFLPAVILFLLTWACTLLAGLMMLEVNLWLPPGANIISMAEETLGTWGKAFSWLTYLFLLYALMSAYLTEIDAFLIKQTQSFFHISLENWQSASFIVLVLGVLIFCGTKTADYLNRIFILGLVIAYFGFLGAAVPEINIAHVFHANFNHMWLTLPIVVTSFGYQIIIPTLRKYLSSDVSKLKRSIIIGSAIPLFAYIIWVFLVVGVVPSTGKYSLTWILSTGQPGTGLIVALEHLLHKDYITTLASMITFYVVATSFIGVSLSLYDFFRDGFHTRKTPGGKFIAVIPTFLPPLIFALVYPHGFIMALGYSGALVAILLLILPAVMAYSGRYIRNEVSHYQAPGGKLAIAFVILFALAVILLELFSNGAT